MEGSGSGVGDFYDTKESQCHSRAHYDDDTEISALIDFVIEYIIMGLEMVGGVGN